MKLVALLFLIVIPMQMEPNFENAKKTAKEKHELILLNFSGSDWCGPCIVLRKDYFESEIFSQMAANNIVFVNADFPRKKKNLPPAEIVRQNEALAEMYNKQGLFPLTLLLDADGKVLKTWQGKPEVSIEEWTAEIKSICQANK